MKKSGDGQITALVPVYECADRLPRHVHFLRRLAPTLADLVWVVTPSGDGSHEIAARACKELGGRLLSVPPGLYPAWNAGISKIKTKYTYISTIGEEITPEGLVAMADLLRKQDADLCFSPPAIVPAVPDSFQRTRHWPVFRFADFLRPYDGRVLPVSMLACLQAISGISGVFGSCASCVFATATLQSRPFPDDFLHYGDTAWFYAHLCRLRTIYRKEVCSTFHVHDLSRRRIRRQDLRRCVDRLCAEYAQIDPRSAVPQMLQAHQHHREMVDRLREPHPFRYWWTNPAAWLWWFRRKASEKKIRSHALKC